MRRAFRESVGVGLAGNTVDLDGIEDDPVCSFDGIAVAGDGVRFVQDRERDWVKAEPGQREDRPLTA